VNTHPTSLKRKIFYTKAVELIWDKWSVWYEIFWRNKRLQNTSVPLPFVSFLKRVSFLCDPPLKVFNLFTLYLERAWFDMSFSSSACWSLSFKYLQHGKNKLHVTVFYLHNFLIFGVALGMDWVVI
jgi:hypothetical protein